MMTARALGFGGLLLAATVGGCGSGALDPGGGIGPSKPPLQIAFVTKDLATGTGTPSVQIYAGVEDIASDFVFSVASALRFAIWPSGVEVAKTVTLTNVSHRDLPNGGVQIGYAEIDVHFDPAPPNPSAWYAISLPPMPSEYTLPDASTAFAFDGGARGVRFSPAHAPVVASVMSCAKDGGVVAVYARYSEPVVRAAGATPLLDYGVPPAGCAIGGDSAVETQFICSNAGAGDQPLWLEIPAGVTAQASGAAMAPGRLDSTAMQTSTTNDGCTVHKPLTVD